jgi:tight adherence protein C
MEPWLPTLITFAAFAGTTAVAFAVLKHTRAQARIARGLRGSGTTEPLSERPGASTAFIVRHFGASRDDRGHIAEGRLRDELVRAGFFSPQSTSYYRFARFAAAPVFIIMGLILVTVVMANKPLALRAGVMIAAAALAAFAPQAYVARRQRQLAAQYRQFFPDFLDLLVVCVDAGLSIDAALDRVSGEIDGRNREFAVNLAWLTAETKAGRGTTDALENFAARLALEEAQSLVLALRQSLSLGSSVAGALTGFSQDMRERRVLRAETEANKLPVKIMAPLGLLIFPVILLVVALPALLRLIPMILMLRNG